MSFSFCSWIVEQLSIFYSYVVLLCICFYVTFLNKKHIYSYFHDPIFKIKTIIVWNFYLPWIQICIFFVVSSLKLRYLKSQFVFNFLLFWFIKWKLFCGIRFVLLYLKFSFQKFLIFYWVKTICFSIFVFCFTFYSLISILKSVDFFWFVL